MDPATIQHYDRNADLLAKRYESAEVQAMHANLLRHLPANCPVLEIGCGSGRDAAFLLAHGFDVAAVDASAEMVATAQRCHPELAGRIHQSAFPLEATSPMLSRRFGAVVMIAILMHLDDQELATCAAQVCELLCPGGVLIVSTSTGRTGLNAGRDADGRLFLERPVSELSQTFERVGFRPVATYDDTDAFNRAISWHSLVMSQATE